MTENNANVKMEVVGGRTERGNGDKPDQMEEATKAKPSKEEMFVLLVRNLPKNKEWEEVKTFLENFCSRFGECEVLSLVNSSFLQKLGRFFGAQVIFKSKEAMLTAKDEFLSKGLEYEGNKLQVIVKGSPEDLERQAKVKAAKKLRLKEQKVKREQKQKKLLPVPQNYLHADLEFNSLVILNEHPAINSREWTELPSTDDGFNVNLRITTPLSPDGKEFTGTGRSKKLAKMRAAAIAINSLQTQKLKRQASPSPFSPITDMMPAVTVYNAKQNVTKRAKRSFDNFPQALNHVLMTRNATVEWQFSETNDVPKAFTASFELEGVRFEGSATSKRLAKHEASRSAVTALAPDLVPLIPLESESPNPVFAAKTPGYNMAGLTSMPMMSGAPARSPGEISRTWTEFIKARSYQYAGLHLSKTHKYTVLSTIIITCGEQVDEWMKTAEVVALTTGNKTLLNAHVPLDGSAVVDCHAEILARRCLIRYLLAQLNGALDERYKESSVIEEVPDSPGKYRVRPIFKFHLFISSPPCGDARDFAFSARADIDDHVNRANRGLLRTKCEGTQASLRCESEENQDPNRSQTFDGFAEGIPLHVMRCSAKIFQWNHIGYQGAMLSAVMEPVFMRSIVIGSLFNEAHISRALWSRNMADELQHALADSGSYGHRCAMAQMPILCGAPTPPPRACTSQPRFAYVWQQCQAEMECVNPCVGKQTIDMQNAPLKEEALSSLCKREMIRLCSSHLLPLVSMSTCDLEKKSYALLKSELGSDYQRAKQALHRASMDFGLGQWVRLPVECSMFSIKGALVNDPPDEMRQLDQLTDYGMPQAQMTGAVAF